MNKSNVIIYDEATIMPKSAKLRKFNKALAEMVRKGKIIFGILEDKKYEKN
jgi:hypothetical protein